MEALSIGSFQCPGWIGPRARRLSLGAILADYWRGSEYGGSVVVVEIGQLAVLLTCSREGLIPLVVEIIEWVISSIRICPYSTQPILRERIQAR